MKTQYNDFEHWAEIAKQNGCAIEKDRYWASFGCNRYFALRNGKVIGCYDFEDEKGWIKQ